VSDVSRRATEEVVAFTLDGVEVTARPGEQLIDACERNGVYIPRFCYHPRMTAVGKCRQCIVEVDTGRGMALQPACMLTVSEGMAVDTESELSKQVQEGVLEHLLINHPLDCPVCDKGGECPLQDQAYSHGPAESRFVEQKRHFEKPIPISDLVYLDRERCILCDRCTRFADEVAGDALIHFIDRGNATQVNTFPDEPFSSYFSGNTVQICPVGALTARPYRFKARPWDLETAESTCQTCSVGCRISIDTSSNRVLRYNGVDADPSTGAGSATPAGSTSRTSTTTTAWARRWPATRAASWPPPPGTRPWLPPPRRCAARATARVRSRARRGSTHQRGRLRLGQAGQGRARHRPRRRPARRRAAGRGRARAAPGHHRPGLHQGRHRGPPRSGPEGGAAGPLPAVAPRCHQRRRHPRRDHPGRHRTDPLRRTSIHPTPGHTAEVVRAVLDGDTAKAVGGVDPSDLAAIGQLLRGSGPLTVVVGRGSMAEAADLTVDAAAVLHDVLPDARFLPALRRGNVFGALDMGLAPGLLPGRIALDEGREWYAEHWPGVPTERGLDAAGILTAAADGHIDTLVLLGADPLADFPDADLAARALAGARTVVALDRFVTESVAKADVVLPVAGFAECDGTTTNLEGRVSRLARRVTPPGTARSDWTIAVELADRLGTDLGFESVQQIWAEVEAISPAHTGITLDVLAQPGNADGVLAPPAERTVSFGRSAEAIGRNATDDAAADDPDQPPSDPDAPGDVAPSTTEAVEPAEVSADHDTQTEVVSGVASEVGAAEDEAVEPETTPAPAVGRPSLLRFVAPTAAPQPGPVDAYALRLVASRKLYDRGTLIAHSPSLAGIGPGPCLRLNPVDFDKVGVTVGTEVRVTSASGSVILPVDVDPGVPRGRAVAWVNQGGPRLTELLESDATSVDVRIEVA
jgi:NADH-quinone oxidoreductase subunit G